jgi:hypothetical protein
MIRSTLSTLVNTTIGRVRRRTSTKQRSMAFRALLSDCPDDNLGSKISIMHETMAEPKPPSKIEDPPLPADPVIEAYKKDVDRTLLRQSLKMTVEERIVSVQKLNQFIEELQRAIQAK